MTEFKPVTITAGSFAFCRYTVAILCWLSLILQRKELVIAVCAIMLLSVILKVRRAPLIVLYRYTIDQIWPSRPVVVDEKGIRFSHLVGFGFSLMCILVLYWGRPIAGWILTGLLAVMKTSAALGYCSALKVYNCMNNGTCCRVGKAVRKIRHD